MGFTPNYTSVFSSIKPQAKLFLGLAVLTIPVVNMLGLDRPLTGDVIASSHPSLLLFSSNFNLISLVVIGLYLLYLAVSVVSSFTGTMLTPEAYYSTSRPVKHTDMPVIPNRANLMAFMSEVDGLTDRGQVRMPDSHLNHLNLDKRGNLLEEQ